MDVRIVSVFALFLCVFAWSEGKPTTGDRRWGNRTLTKEEEQRLTELWRKYGPNYSEYNEQAHEFPCEITQPSAVEPLSVHRLRPGDVKVVAAMGDSLTAGTGIEATNILGVLTQNRGLSWSGGGETAFEEQITLPNILKKYNPTVYGYATGDGDEWSKKSVFNVAVSGSTSSDLVRQVQELILRIYNDPNVDFNKDWKVVTILTGNNDLCDYCNEPDQFNAQRYYEHLTSGLDIMQAQLPRTLVNLVEPLNMEIVTELNKGILCSALHLFTCDCAAFPANADAEKELIYEADTFQNVVESIALSGRYDTTEDFTVVYQPFFNGTYLPRLWDGEPDLSYFAPDCFHLSRKGQDAAASALWDNMMEPVGAKTNKWTPGERLICPSTGYPFIYTNKNSGSSAPGLDAEAHEAAKGNAVGVGAAAAAGPSQKTENPSSHTTTVIAVSLCGAVIAIVVVVALTIRRNRRRHAYGAI